MVIKRSATRHYFAWPAFLLQFFISLVIASFCPDVAAEAPKEIRIAGIFDLSSESGQVWGKAERDGFLLAVKHFEAGRLNTKITRSIEDSGYSNEKTVTALQKLVAIDSMKLVVGPTWEVFHSIMPICERQKIVCVAPSFHGEEFHQEDDPPKFSFSGYPRDALYGSSLAEEVNKRKLKRVAVLSGNFSPYYENLTNAFISSLRTPALRILRVGAAEQDFRSLIGKIPADIEALFLLMDPVGQPYNALRQWKQLKRSRPLIFTDDGTIALSSQAAEIKMLGFDIFYSQPQGEIGLHQEWKDIYHAEYRKEPESPSAFISYCATMLGLECLELVETQDPLALRECYASHHTKEPRARGFTFAGQQIPKEIPFVVKKLQ